MGHHWTWWHFLHWKVSSSVYVRCTLVLEGWLSKNERGAKEPLTWVRLDHGALPCSNHAIWWSVVMDMIKLTGAEMCSSQSWQKSQMSSMIRELQKVKMRSQGKYKDSSRSTQISWIWKFCWPSYEQDPWDGSDFGSVGFMPPFCTAVRTSLVSARLGMLWE